MKSIVLTGIRQMEQINQFEPELIEPDDVLIQIKSIGVCGSDMHYYKEGNIGEQVVQFPFVVGHEFSGQVKAVGKGVTHLKLGDRVAVDPNIYCGKCDQCIAGRHHTCRNQKFLGCPGQLEGCNKEWIVMPARCCFVIPDRMSYDDGMLIEPLSIGIYAAEKAGEVKGLDIAIWGYGPIGMCVHEALKMNGARDLFVAEPLEYRRKLAIQHGAHCVEDPLGNRVVETFLKQKPEQLDVVYDCCGKQEAVDDALKCLKPGGKLVIVGIPEFDRWSFSTEILRRREITVLNVRRQNQCEKKSIAALNTGNINLQGMITHRFPLHEAKKAYDLVAGYHDNVMKAVLIP